MSKEKERKLTKAELKRKEEFEKLSERLAAEGYRPNHITMSVLMGNVLALVTALPFVLPMLIVFMIIHEGISLGPAELLVFLVLMILLTVVHELIHGITWSRFVEGGWKSISFGFIAEYLTPYCSCNQPMKKHQIIIGALMPTLLLGIIPGIIALFTGSSLLMALALVMIVGGGADMMIACKLLLYRSKCKEVLFIDHPYELGTAVFEK